MELHPKIDVHNLKLLNTKIILGSFPTWSLTHSDDELIMSEKLSDQIRNGDLPYFYGSSSNKFWNWYQTYVDPSISPENILEIESSLKKNSIGITDVIISCIRKNKSALDKHLTNRKYNHHFFQMPLRGQTLKILCSSKGVMNDMLLNKAFLKTHSNLTIDETSSVSFQNKVLEKINGDSGLIKQPFFRSLTCDTGGNIECFSTPSPGSPYRKLEAFGFHSGNLDDYLNSYLFHVFQWFIK